MRQKDSIQDPTREGFGREQTTKPGAKRAEIQMKLYTSLIDIRNTESIERINKAATDRFRRILVRLEVKLSKTSRLLASEHGTRNKLGIW